MMRLHRALPLVLLGTAIAAAPAQALTSNTTTNELEQAALTARHERQAFFDIRAAVTGIRAITPLQTAAQRLLRTTVGSRLSVEEDALTATPHAIVNLGGALSPPTTGAATTVALDWVRGHLDALGLTADDLDGLRKTYDYTSPDGVTHLIWVQTAGGVPAFDNALRVSVAKDGRVIAFSGSPLHGLHAPPATDLISKATAVLKTLKLSGITAKALGGLGDGVAPVLFFDGKQVLRAWRVRVTATSTMVIDAVIGARDGKLLWRGNAVDWANGLAWDYYPGAAKGGTATAHDFSPYLNATDKLTGPNVHAFLDLNDDNTESPADEVAPGADGNWSYPYNPVVSPLGNCPKAGCTWDHVVPNSYSGNQAQNTTQVFYFLNHYHDHLAASPIDFTKAAGNFEGDDYVQANTLDGANSGLVFIPNPLKNADNANMATGPDGLSPRMQMYLFEPLPPPFGPTLTGGDPFSDVNGGDDASVIYHEYTHGLTNRLVIDGAGDGALFTPQAGAMGEAWSDWYALDFITAQGLLTDTDASGEIDEGPFTDSGQNLIRTEPIDCPVGADATHCPRNGGPGGSGGYTYADFGKIIGSPEVHADGEIWGQTLWDLRSKLGSKRTEELVTRALPLSPPEPSFLDMRNAILAADSVTGGKDHATIWAVFAHRGMGYFAVATSGEDTTPVADTSLPPAAGGPTGSIRGRALDQSGAPVPYAHAAIGGHGSELPDDFATDADADGYYTITGLPVGTYKAIVVGGDGYSKAVVTGGAVTAGQTLNVGDTKISRDWALLSGGASVSTRKGIDTFGCGPGFALDGDSQSGFEAYAPQNPYDPGDKGFTVKLPTPVDVKSINVDPGPNCGDEAGSQLKDYALEVSSDGTSFQKVIDGSFGLDAASKPNAIGVPDAISKGVRYVRITMKSDQGPLTSVVGSAETVVLTGGIETSALFIDLSDLSVIGAAPDKVAPKIALAGPKPTVVKVGPVTLHGTASDDVALREVRAGDAPVTVSSKGTFALKTAVPAGKTLVSALAIDGAGNRTLAHRTVLGDAHAPTVRVVSVRRHGKRVTVRLRVGDDTGVTKVTVNTHRAKLKGKSARVTFANRTSRSVGIVVTDRAGRKTKRSARVR